MAKWHKNAPPNSPSIELDESEVPAWMRHLEEQEAKGLPGVFPWPDTIPLEIVDDDENV